MMEHTLDTHFAEVGTWHPSGMRNGIVRQFPHDEHNHSSNISSNVAHPPPTFTFETSEQWRRALLEVGS